MIFVEKPSYRPCSGIPAVIWFDESPKISVGFKPIKTCIVLLAAKFNSLAAPRSPANRSVTEPDEDNVNVAPLKTSDPFPTRVGGTLIGCGPEPLSAVSMRPVKSPDDSRRLVMLTLRKMKRLATNVAAGWPPEHWNTRSPVLSVMPSPCTMAGVADGVQVNVVALTAGSAAAHKSRGKWAKNGRNMGVASNEKRARCFDYTCSVCPVTIIKLAAVFAL